MENEQQNIKKPSKVAKWSLIVAIVILLNLFINYSISLVYESPKFENFCPEKQINISPTNQEECLAEGGSWTNDPIPKRIDSPDGTTQIIEGYCDITYTCRQEFETTRETYERNIFITLVSIGVIIFILSLVLNSNYVISTSLAMGALLDFIVASIRYWSSADNVAKVIILAIALGILIYLGYKKFSDK